MTIETTNISAEVVTLPHICLQQEIVSDFREGLEREWLVTNGIGGYASASLSGANTRRYHGLLVAALQPPLGRTVLLGKLDEEVSFVGQKIQLGVNEWRDGATSLDGFASLKQAEFAGTLPTFYYQFGPASLTKTIWMEYGFNTTYVRYTYHATAEAGSLLLQVRPLANSRDYHGSTHGHPDWHFQIETEAEQSWKVAAWDGAPQWRLLVFDQSVEWQPNNGPGWYWGFRYRQEEARGLEAEEDMYCLGSFSVGLKPGQSVTFAASTATPEIMSQLYPGSRDRELARQLALLGKANLSQPQSKNSIEQLATRLTLAADQFIVGRPDPAQPGQLQPDYRTIMAGYHWFGDWGRDTMISLPGLTLATGRYDEAALILRSFSRFVSKGMLPNRFPDNPQEVLPESEYNTVDATLWYFDAVEKYLKATEDWELGRELYPVLAEIMRWHIQGTRFNIKVDEKDGLLFSGAEGVQLTWMDAKIGDWVVTPRRGKPIEINALWYHACRGMTELARRFGTTEEAKEFANLTYKIALNFEEAYWYETGGYFYDLINEFGQPDPALRPNQIIALAIAPELFSTTKAEATLAQLRQHLLIPFGLRTLSPQDPAYRPTYGGDAYSRDSAYHQGTVWPWLLGPFGQVVLRLEGREALEAVLAPFVEQLDEAAVGQLNEIFGAEPPYPPVGCIAQAWSIAQLLEVWQLYKLQG